MRECISVSVSWQRFTGAWWAARGSCENTWRHRARICNASKTEYEAEYCKHRSGNIELPQTPGWTRLHVELARVSDVFPKSFCIGETRLLTMTVNTCKRNLHSTGRVNTFIFAFEK